MTKILTLSLMLLIAPVANAGITGIGFGIHGGLVSGYDDPVLEETVHEAFQGLVDFELSDQLPNVGIHFNVGTLRVIEFDASIDYMWENQTVYQEAELTYSVVSGSASIKKTIPMGVVGPYIGAGFGAYHSAYSFTESNVTVVLPSDQTSFGYHAKAGLSFNIPSFPLTPFAEFRYNQVQTEDEPTKFYQINAGLTFNLP